MGDTYRPPTGPRSQTPSSDRYNGNSASSNYHDEDRLSTSEAHTEYSIRGASTRDDVRQRHRSRSPHRGGGRGGYRERDARYDRNGYSDPREVDHSSDGYSSRPDYSRCDQEAGRLPKRPYHGRDRQYEELDFYAEAPYVDPPYRGENDISLDGKPMRLLLVRNLKESVTEELFAKGLEKLYRGSIINTDPNEAQIGAQENTLHRVLIIRDRQTDKSMSFGFAEYHSIPSAVAALAKAEELGDKCTIGSKAIEVSFPHLTVFPRADFGGQERDARFTVEMKSTGARHKYHDDRYYASGLVVNAQDPNRESSTSKDGAGVENGEGGLEAVKEKSKKRKAPGTTATTAAAAPAFLQHWQNKAAELRTAEREAAAAREQEKSAKAGKSYVGPVSGVNAISAPAPAAAAPKKMMPDATVEQEVEQQVQTFAIDTQKLKCCYLCACQFQTSEGVQRHLKESAKHAENIANDTATTKGYDRLKKAGVAPESTIKLLLPATGAAGAVDGAKKVAEQAEKEGVYRDRAAERRKEEAATGTKETMPSFSLKAKTTKASNSPACTPEPTAPSYGKGLGMLQKAGWTAGQGLGSGSGSGEGRAAPIETNLYAAGVGLGHEGSRKGDAVEEAERMTRGDRGGFLEKTKEVARERWERMN